MKDFQKKIKNYYLSQKKVVYKEVRKDFYSPVEDLKFFEYIETINCTYKTILKENGQQAK